MKNSIGFWIVSLALAGFSLLGFVSCNLDEPEDTYILSMKLDDSLTVERKLFQTIDIDVFDGNGTLTHADVFHAPYHRSDSAKIAKLALKSKLPDPMTIRITAYKSAEVFWVFTIKITNGNQVKLEPVYTGPIIPVVPNPGDPTAPTGIIITNPTTPFLYLGDSAISLSARAEPTTATQTVTWSVASGDAAVLESANRLKAMKTGTFTLKATSTQDISKSATLEMTVQSAATLPPDSVVISHTAPLLLTVNGPSIALNGSVLPVGTRQEIVWSLPPNSAAILETGNRIKGIKPGNVILTASSFTAPTVSNTLLVTVSEPAVLLPESISLKMATPMILAVGKADGDLLWSVLPVGSDTGVEWTSSDITIAQITVDNKVRPMKKGPATITGKSKAKPSVTATFEVNVIVPVKVDAISMLPKVMDLYSGGPEKKLTVTMTGSDSSARYSLVSSDNGVATVSADGSVKGLTAGVATITASVAFYPEIAAVCSVRVVKDAPVVTVGPNQSVAFNGEALFTVSVAPQAYGTTVEIKADMDGDSVYEQTVLNKETADFKQKYTEVKSTTVSFKVKDTEGNEVTVTRKVTVGAPGVPLVSIIKPSKDTTIRADSLKIAFTVKDASKNIDVTIDSTVRFLVEGKNTIRVARGNVGGEGWDEIEATVDRIGPARPVFTAWTAGQDPTINNRPIWKWAAIPDAAKYQVKLDNSDTSAGMIDVIAATQYQPPANLLDGVRTLHLRAIDAAGNVSAVASLAVTVKASPPAKPVAVETPVSPATLRTPVWKWRSGDATKGNGKFKIWLNDVEQSISSIASYTGSALPDGAYILKVKELDDLGTESVELVFAQILIDGARPVITVSGRTSGDMVSLTTTRAATVTGSIVETGGSGLTSATWELSGGTTRAATVIGTPGSFSINTGNMTNGSATSLIIRAADGAKNAVAFTIIFNVNIPKPTLAFVSPTPADGHVSNGAITAYYSIDGGPTQDTVLTHAAPASGETSTLINLAVTAQNEGGSTTITRTFYRTNAGVRFYTASGTTGGDCNSWARACKFEGTLPTGTAKFFWLQSGQYDMSGSATPFNAQNAQIFGGIRANGKNILDRSGETVILSSNPSTGRSHLGGATVVTNITVTGDYNDKVFSADPGGLIRFVECKFAAVTANGSNSYFGTLMYSSEVNLRFERCTFDNSQGNGAYLVGGKDAPYYNLFQSCTFIPRGDGGNDFENGSSDPLWFAFRFVNPTGAPRMMLENACGLPGSAACP